MTCRIGRSYFELNTNTSVKALLRTVINQNLKNKTLKNKGQVELIIELIVQDNWTYCPSSNWYQFDKLKLFILKFFLNMFYKVHFLVYSIGVLTF